MSKRKTVELRKAIQYANGFLSAPGGTQESRYGVICFLESILFNASQYKGFRYLTPMELRPEDAPGIFPSNEPHKMFDNTDPTRRSYPEFI
jgi:hypothetical protein